MITDKRKAPRRPMRYAAWIALKPDELHGCALSDISDSGARIDIDDSKAIPDRFILYLSSNGAARRPCTVVWRKPKQLGVAFAKRLAPEERAKLMASPSLVPAPDETATAESE